MMPTSPFKDADYALLVGARPRGPGMERKDLLEANAAIFSVQGKAINDSRQPRHPRARCRQSCEHQRIDCIQQRTGYRSSQLHGDDAPGPQSRHGAAGSERPAATSMTSGSMTIWGNHSATQYPDVNHATVKGDAAAGLRRPGLACGGIHSGRTAARRSNYRGTRRIVGRVRGFGSHRPYARLGAWHARRRLGLAWQFPPTAATASHPASSIPIRSPVRMADTRSSRI